jgi:hypothetical protein
MVGRPVLRGGAVAVRGGNPTARDVTESCPGGTIVGGADGSSLERDFRRMACPISMTSFPSPRLPKA